MISGLSGGGENMVMEHGGDDGDTAMLAAMMGKMKRNFR